MSFLHGMLRITSLQRIAKQLHKQR